MNQAQAPDLDRAAFQSVWRRVMPEDRPDCPFTLDPPASPAAPTPALITPPEQLPPSQPQSAPVICLGPLSDRQLPALTVLMDQTAAAHRAYRALSRRAPGALPASLAAAKRRQFKRLSAAYFLISGQRHVPRPSPSPAAPASLPSAIRARYQAEQSAALEFLAAAGASSDPCLIDLCRAIALENQVHAGQLREWLERV